MPKKDEKKQEEDIKEVEAATEEVVESEVEPAVEVEEPAVVESADEEIVAETESIESTPDSETIEIEGASTSEPFDPEKPVTVQPVKFASFEDSARNQGEINKNLDILMDIKLQLTVELGRTELPIKKVLELTRGSIIELEKVAGEPVELYANGKLVAHGEVVVIEDNFGLRITSITDPEDRIKGIS